MKTPTLRRATRLVLGLGTGLAVVAAFGPLWLVRTGLVVAVAAGVLACALAWRELFSERRQHAHAMLVAMRQHGAALTEERSRNAAVVDTLSERARSAGMVIAGQRVTMARLGAQVGALHGETTRLVAAVAQRDRVITALRDAVAARDAELVAVREDQTARVHHLPRRVLTKEESRRPMVLPNYEDDRQVG